MYSEEDAGEWTQKIAGASGDTLLQTWMLGKTPVEHAQRLAASGGVRFQKSLRVLDAGCGTGQLLLLLKVLYPEASMYGINLFQSQLDLNCFGDQLHLFQGSIADPDAYRALGGEPFDVVFMNYTSGHLSTAELKQAFCNIAERMAPNARLVLWDITARSVMVRTFFEYRLRLPSEVSAIAEKAGLRPFERRVGFEDVSMTDSFLKATTAEEQSLFEHSALPVLYVFVKSEE